MLGGKRSRPFLRDVLAVAGTILVLWLLSRIPYGLLREERVRAFGEARTTAWVLERIPRRSGDPAWRLRVRYRGPDGRARETIVPVSQDFWSASVPGSGVEGFVARADPSLCRLSGQIEEPFRVWLRSVLENEEP
jgi:hypothetical protein